MAKSKHHLHRLTFVDYIIYFIMILVLLICIVPFIYMLALSFSGAKAIINNEVSFWPKDFTVDAYKQIFEYPHFFRAYGNTLFYTICGTGIALVMTTLFAYPLSKAFLRGQKIVMRFVIFTMFFSGGLIPTYLIIGQFLNLAGTVWVMLLPFAISPFNLIILTNFFKSIPQEIEEASLIDGLGYFGILRRMVVPLSTAAIATIGLYYAVFFWNDWFNALIYLNSAQYPVMLFLRNIVNGTTMVGDGAGAADKSTIAISIKSAVIITSTVPILLLYPILQRFFVVGLTVGAVKG
jgi:ABC-type sugar transport system, permease component